MNYQIIIEENSFKQQVNVIGPKLILVDKNVGIIDTKFATEYIAVSETEKNFDLYFTLLDLFNNYDLNRTDTVMIIGGGVLIDVASFAASTFKRGIKYVNVPTTTLSMIDSSVGSKNGLNYKQVKNLIGNITDPDKVIIDISFLKTLDDRNFNNGIAEAIKIGYLSNPSIIEELLAEKLDVEQVIKLSVAEKLKYVEADKQDFGYRNYLNFGHTFGHAIESITNFEQFFHGEAVAIGMVIASGYDRQLIELLTKFGLPTELPVNINIDKLINLMMTDKKNTSDKIKIILKQPDLKIVEHTPAEVKKLIDCRLIVDNKFRAEKMIVNKSKSYIHRLLAAALATKSSIQFEFDINNDLSDDVIQSINVLKNCNVEVSFAAGKFVVDAKKRSKPNKPFYIYKSATTYRIFTPILCSLFGSVEIRLDKQLQSRPHDVFSPYIEGDVHSLPFTTDNYCLDGSISSQFVSGYIIAIAATKDQGSIEIINQMTSTPYIDMTIEIINMFGFEVIRNQQLITITASEDKGVKDFYPEPDFSSLAYLVVFNKIAEIRNQSFKINYQQYQGKSLQADSCIFELLDELEIDMSNCPDLLPTLVVYGLLNKRGLVLTNIDRIRFKECDRVMAMLDNYQDLNAIIKDGDRLIIKPVEKISGRTIKTFGDHRIAMASSIIAPFCSGAIIIDDYTVVNKSFPTFFQQLRGE